MVSLAATQTNCILCQFLAPPILTFSLHVFIIVFVSSILPEHSLVVIMYYQYYQYGDKEQLDLDVFYVQ